MLKTIQYNIQFKIKPKIFIQQFYSFKIDKLFKIWRKINTEILKKTFSHISLFQGFL